MTDTTSTQPAGEHGSAHPLGVYLRVWGLLFVLSVLSYLVDYADLQGYLKWSLIILFMWLKAGLIVAIFMHMAWERPALICAILVPPGVIAVLVLLIALEANYTQLLRLAFGAG